MSIFILKLRENFDIMFLKMIINIMKEILRDEEKSVGSDFMYYDDF